MIFNEANARTPECHASTIAEVGDTLVCAWFGGLYEKHPSVGIWLSHNTGSGWSRPREVATGVDANGQRVPCWNPVLFQPQDGPLVLFYKTGRTIAGWQTHYMTSGDAGRTWSSPVTLENPVMGPVRNKPVQLEDGTILYGGSDEPDWQSWQLFFSRSTSTLTRWELTGPVTTPDECQAIQPAFLRSGGDVVALFRTRQGLIGRVESSDGGGAWSAPSLTSLPNPNSGIDAVTLRSGLHILVYNDSVDARSPLVVAVSGDTHRWRTHRVLESGPGEFSYPAVIESADGTVHVTYTWNRRCIAHVRISDISE